ncbi:hypothetical protein TCAL_10934 [Tigriopus californicus]|uniref:Cytochrome P450 n=1 Tax=Tigriopus californicus TaxID=6832 RepID=A0A553PHL8_TIGCA|nr:methyl farnesoate epoxidase-like [Tigriopus californicus]TRY77176.1 hypothetical protein TCAL_10934 [Tigriopus californicus]|eukprot:TCALIF_10934-PA protein Name:"Similar to CYP2J2 Cytochrome P450 2J2 (Homo sapiens)" AED:0.07 eAED:0.07 QI:47/1/0.87/1/0.28/0.25/8/218/484
MSVLTFVVIGLLLYWSLKKFMKPRNFPPGPPSIPILGSLPFMPKEAMATGILWQHFKSRYGKVMGMMIGDQPVIGIYDFDLIKEAYSKEEFSARPNSELHDFRMLGKKRGIVMNDGYGWKVHRRFTLKTLKDFGFGNASVEDGILEEANHICDHIAKKNGSPFKAEDVFNVGILNIMWKILTHKRFDLEDPRLANCVRAINGQFSSDRVRIVLAMPWTRHFFPEMSGWNDWKKFAITMQDMTKQILDEHEPCFGPNHEPLDFITAYKEEAKRTGDPEFNDRDLQTTISDIFVASSDTTAHTLSWGLLYMILHPDIQKKVQHEIDDALLGREPTLEDRARLVYTDATLAEIQRRANIVPGALPHRVSKEMKLGGYTIPKDSMVISSLYYVMHDPDYWKNADQFDPTRFIENGKFRKDERFVPFGIGKRICLGDTLARNELFVVFIRLMQRFNFEASPDHPYPKEEYLPSTVMGPKPFHLRAIPRS